jgi:polar amino acid transport system substrate-binding protein
MLSSALGRAKGLMNRILACLAVATLLGGVVAAQNAPDPRVADILQTGKIRIGLFSSQFIKDAASGELRGVRPDMARALAARIGVQAVLIEYVSPPGAIECLKTGACDAVFLPKDTRTVSIGEFSFPFVQSEFTFLVPAGSGIFHASEADKPGIRIAAVRGHASAATLTHVIKQAEVIVDGDEQSAFESLRAGRVQALASTRQSLGKAAKELQGSRVLADRYGAQFNRIVVPKGRTAWLAFVNEFVEEAKRSGLVQRAIEREGISAFELAPPGESE